MKKRAAKPRTIVAAADPLGGDQLLKAKSAQPQRRRISAERQQEIVEGAVRYFAEHGFDGNTRDLAERLGVSQALLFKYFPTKDDLIDRIYEDVFVGRWNPAWEIWLEDTSRPVDERITAFYLDYARVILNYEWVRLYMFSSLRGFDLAKRYSKILRARIFPKVIAAIRASRNLPPITKTAITPEEMEVVASLHAAIFYMGVRQWVYNIAPEMDIEASVITKVKAFLIGASQFFEQQPSRRR
jgi:AcrR family transcriptional regulator